MLIQNILHPTDFSERSEYALQLASALARDYGARLLVLHVAAPTLVVYGVGMIDSQSEKIRDEVRKKFQELQARDAKLRLETRLAVGDAAGQIVGIAREAKSDLIVMGTHGWTGLSRLLMGSVAEQVARNAPCPVLTVKTPFVERTAEQAVPARIGRALEASTT
jgi:nucleotide-binding universal stress UspA family protein